MDELESDHDTESTLSEPIVQKSIEEVIVLENHNEEWEEKYSMASSTNEFKEFFSKASHLMERCIRQPFDPLFDYTEDRSNTVQSQKAEKANIENVFYDSDLCQNKAVTSLSWSNKFEELFLATYCNSETSHENDGLAIIWSRHYPRRKEYALHCETAISIARFYPYNPSLIIGGTYTGQIVVWDLRVNTSYPVSRTSISSRSHTEPVFGMEFVGSSENSHNLITMSTDGRVCTWSMNKLDSPPDVVDLHHTSATREFNAELVLTDPRRTSTYTTPILSQVMKFPKGEVNTFFVGSENGTIFSADRFGSSTGINEAYTGHFAPVTSIDTHPSIEFSDLMVSSSMDWTCKLWSQKKQSPLLSFEEFEDYVYDVKWSPQHPSLFAAADGAGYLSLWNVNIDQEMPVFKSSTGTSALNKISWSNDGKRIATGSISGHVYLYSLDDELSIPKQKEIETKLLESVIVDNLLGL